MARKNPHIGSSFENRLDDAGIREESRRPRSRP
jgi:hypothetical protein